MKTSTRLAMGAAALTAFLSAASPSLAQPSTWCWYHSCPDEGFGSRTSVTLPPDRHPPAGKSSGIPIGKIARPEIPSLSYFRPK
jgi:hypothetical protein